MSEPRLPRDGGQIFLRLLDLLVLKRPAAQPSQVKFSAFSPAPAAPPHETRSRQTATARARLCASAGRPCRARPSQTRSASSTVRDSPTRARAWPGKSRRYRRATQENPPAAGKSCRALFRLARLEASDAKVGMHAYDYTLEQLLIRLPRRRHQLLAVGRHAADQSAGRDDRRERPRVDVITADSIGTPHLARSVNGLARPRRGRQPHQRAPHFNEAARQIRLGVVLRLDARIPVDANTRLAQCTSDLTRVGLLATTRNSTSSFPAVISWSTTTPSLSVDRSLIRRPSGLASTLVVVCGITVWCQSRRVEPGRQNASMYQT